MPTSTTIIRSRSRWWTRSTVAAIPISLFVYMTSQWRTCNTTVWSSPQGTCNKKGLIATSMRTMWCVPSRTSGCAHQLKLQARARFSSLRLTPRTSITRRLSWPLMRHEEWYRNFVMCQQGKSQSTCPCTVVCTYAVETLWSTSGRASRRIQTG